jgi:hypothetical protein
MHSSLGDLPFTVKQKETGWAESMILDDTRRSKSRNAGKESQAQRVAMGGKGM